MPKVIIRKSSEHLEQSAVIEWARRMSGRWPILRYLHAIPNGAVLARRQGAKVSFQAMKLKAEGLTPGVPDLFLPCARGGYHGLYIEMKYGKNTPTPEQREFMETIDGEGYLCLVCWGADAAIESIENYIQGIILKDSPKTIESDSSLT